MKKIATLFGADVTKCPYAPSWMDAAVATKMKEVAMEAVQRQ